MDWEIYIERHAFMSDQIRCIDPFFQSQSTPLYLKDRMSRND